MSSADEQPRMPGATRLGDHTAETEANPDKVALDELLRAFAIDATRIAEEDRTDSEIDRHVDEVLGEAVPDGLPDAPSSGSNGGSADAAADGAADRAADGAASAPESDGGPPTAPLGDDAATPEQTVAPPPHVIAIADDEFPPDAVYVEGDLGGPDTSGDRPVVFIDDDVVVTESPEDSRRLRRRMEPRLRDRRISVRRAESRRRLRWVLLAVFVLAVNGAGMAV